MAYLPDRPMTTIAMGLTPIASANCDFGYYVLYQKKVDAEAFVDTDFERDLTYFVNFVMVVVLCDLVPRNSCVIAVDEMLSHTHHITCWSNFRCT